MIQVGFTPTSMSIIPYNITIINNDYYIIKLSNRYLLFKLFHTNYTNILWEGRQSKLQTHTLFMIELLNQLIRLLMQTDDLMLYLWCCYQNKFLYRFKIKDLSIPFLIPYKV